MLYPIILDRVSKIFLDQTSPYIPFTMIIALLIVVKHWTNIKRLIKGEESKFSFKKSVKQPEPTGNSNNEADK